MGIYELKTHEDFLKAGYEYHFDKRAFIVKGIGIDSEMLPVIPPFGITDKMLAEGWKFFSNGNFEKPSRADNENTR